MGLFPPKGFKFLLEVKRAEFVSVEVSERSNRCLFVLANERESFVVRLSTIFFMWGCRNPSMKSLFALSSLKNEAKSFRYLSVEAEASLVSFDHWSSKAVMNSLREEDEETWF